MTDSTVNALSADVWDASSNSAAWDASSNSAALPPRTGALTDIRVVDLSRVLAGHCAGRCSLTTVRT